MTRTAREFPPTKNEGTHMLRASSKHARKHPSSQEHSILYCFSGRSKIPPRCHCEIAQFRAVTRQAENYPTKLFLFFFKRMTLITNLFNNPNGGYNVQFSQLERLLQHIRD